MIKIGAILLPLALGACNATNEWAKISSAVDQKPKPSPDTPR